MSQEKSLEHSQKALLGARMKRVREELSLTQEQLAPMLGVHHMTLSKYETGVSEPAASVLLELCRIAEKISPDWLLSGEGPMMRAGAVPGSWDAALQGVDWNQSDLRQPGQVPREDYDAVVRELTAAVKENRQLRELNQALAALSPSQRDLLLKMATGANRVRETDKDPVVNDAPVEGKG